MAEDDRWIGYSVVPISVDDQLFTLRIHMGRINGVAKCIGVDLRAFQSNSERDALPELLASDAEPNEIPLLAPEGLRTGWAEVNTTVFRSVRLASAITKAVEDLRTTAAWQRHKAATGKDAFAYWVSNPPWESESASPEERALRDDPGKPKRGARSRLTAELVEHVVAPAWLDSASGRIEAVRQALEHYWQERVTVDQAKKAISKARSAGFIPPARKEGSS